MTGPDQWDEPSAYERHTAQGKTPEHWGRPWRTSDGLEHPVTTRRITKALPADAA